MRADIAKLTTERERRGSSHCHSKKYGGRVRIIHDEEHDYENEFGGFRSSSRHRHQDSKDLSDVLTPLRGALRANLGRPWDKVYSEFCQFLDRRSVSGIHIFSHLCGNFGMVTHRGLYVGEDNKVYEHSAGRYTKDYEVSGFYVHPVTGILRYAEDKRFKKDYRTEAEIEKLRSGKVEIDDYDYELIDNLWFEVWYEQKKVQEFNDAYVQNRAEEWYITHGYIKHEGKWGHWGFIHVNDFVIRKRSLSRKQIQVVKQHIEDRIKELMQ